MSRKTAWQWLRENPKVHNALPADDIDTKAKEDDDEIMQHRAEIKRLRGLLKEALFRELASGDVSTDSLAYRIEEALEGNSDG